MSKHTKTERGYHVELILDSNTGLDRARTVTSIAGRTPDHQRRKQWIGGSVEYSFEWVSELEATSNILADRLLHHFHDAEFFVRIDERWQA